MYLKVILNQLGLLYITSTREDPENPTLMIEINSPMKLFIRIQNFTPKEIVEVMFSYKILNKFPKCVVCKSGLKLRKKSILLTNYVVFARKGIVLNINLMLALEKDLFLLNLKSSLLDI
ncbi:hypothetical protein H311_02858 [Anncaliia algerae PRA109]|nr:hypothetical protein H311_02858 [Anncaliia algerae PRA109]